MADSLPFTINITGESTGEVFKGTFKAKVRLSHRDELRRDELRRKLLGPTPDAASKRAQNQAELIADLSVRLTETPKWWSTVDGGLDLEDDNVLIGIWEECTRLEKEAIERVLKEAEDAKIKLREIADADTVGQ